MVPRLPSGFVRTVSLQNAGATSNKKERVKDLATGAWQWGFSIAGLLPFVQTPSGAATRACCSKRGIGYGHHPIPDFVWATPQATGWWHHCGVKRQSHLRCGNHGLALHSWWFRMFFLVVLGTILAYLDIAGTIFCGIWWVRLWRLPSPL